MRSTQVGSAGASTVGGPVHGTSSSSSSGRLNGGSSPSAGLGLGSPITRLRSPQLPYTQGGESSQLRRPPSARPVSAAARPATGAVSGGGSSRPGTAVRPTSGSTSSSPRGGNGGLGLSGLRRGVGNGRIANGW